MTLFMKHPQYLNDLMHKAVNRGSLSYPEVVYLLSLEDPSSIEQVMSTSRQIREQHFGNKIFLYGFIYFSTYCRNQCNFCYYRKSNKLSPRYRKSLAEIEGIATELTESGVHLLDLTMGEDPIIHNTGNYDMLREMTNSVREKTGLPIMISPGVIPGEVIRDFGKDKVDWYALYQETHNPILFRKLRVHQSFEERRAKRMTAIRAGMLVEDGMLIGVGETISDRANSILAMKNDGVHQARVMSLVPQPQTPMFAMEPISRVNEQLCIAVIRLVMPDRLIPASLDVDGIKGLKMRLDAGANVVTSLIPPLSNLAGVSQSSLDIEQGLRTVPEVKKILAQMNLKVAELSGYVKWLDSQKRKVVREEAGCHAESMYSRRSTTGNGSGLPIQTGWL